MSSSNVKAETGDGGLGFLDKYKTQVIPSIRQAFESSHLNDVTVICYGGSSVSTSAVLLAAISPWLRVLMEEAGTEEFCLCLPFLTSHQLSLYLDTFLTTVPSQRNCDRAELDWIHRILMPGHKPNSQSSWEEEVFEFRAPHVKLEEGDGGSTETGTALFNFDLDEVDQDEPFVLDDDEDYKEEEMKTKAKNVKIDNGDNREDSKEKRKRGRPKSQLSQDLLCPHCGQEFIKGSRRDISKVYQRHLLKHQVENFSCECPGVPKTIPRPGQERIGMDFKLKERHMKVEHLGWLGCDECIQCFESQDKLLEHTEKHKLTFICDLCGFVAQNQTSLKDHTKKKHESSPIPCPDCGKIMGSKIALDSHKRKVHCASACSVCGVVIKNMKMHMQEMHIDDSEKRYQCQDCGKGFMDKQRLKDHRMNMHIKSQPHKCRYGCENRYNDKSNRNAHERRRHGEVYNTNHARNVVLDFRGISSLSTLLKE